MKKRELIIKSILLFTAISITAINKLFAQDDSAALAAADSTHFSVNKINGWQLFNSYLSQYKTDSVQLELIIQHDNDISWDQEQYIGKIKDTLLFPQIEQGIPFNLLNDEYMLRIETNGKCYLHFVSGSMPASDPVVIPMKIYYKL